MYLVKIKIFNFNQFGLKCKRQVHLSYDQYLAANGCYGLVRGQHFWYQRMAWAKWQLG